MSALSDALARLDADRAAFLAAYDALTPAQRAFRPADGGWTADEVVQHLVKAETGTVAIITKQAAAGDARRDVGTPDDARLAQLCAHLRSDGRAAMPEAAAPFIRPDSPPDAGWRDRLADFGDAWHRFDETLADDARDAALMLHPRAGALRADGAAEFVAAHIDHHARQIARLRASEGFPEASA